MFEEATGLSSESIEIEYRQSNSVAFSTVKMPGLKKTGEVILKKGRYNGDKSLWDKYSSVKMNTVKRSNITISLMDESQQVAMSWTLSKAFATKITFNEKWADQDEMVIETLVLIHEGLMVAS